MKGCFEKVRTEVAPPVLESRMDEALFDKKIVGVIDEDGVRFTASVPFERFAELKGMSEHRKRWWYIDKEW